MSNTVIEDFLQECTNGATYTVDPDGGVTVDGSMYISARFSDERLPFPLRKVVGTLSFERTNFEKKGIRDLGILEEVTEDLLLTQSMVRSLGKLRTVGGNLHLGYSEIEDLGDLQYIGKSLWAEYSPNLKDLKGLTYIGKELALKNSEIMDLIILSKLGALFLLDSFPLVLGHIDGLRYVEFGRGLGPDVDGHTFKSEHAKVMTAEPEDLPLLAVSHEIPWMRQLALKRLAMLGGAP